MGYRMAQKWECWADAFALRVAMWLTDSDDRARWLNDSLVRSMVVQGEDGTLRVLC